MRNPDSWADYRGLYPPRTSKQREADMTSVAPGPDANNGNVVPIAEGRSISGWIVKKFSRHANS